MDIVFWIFLTTLVLLALIFAFPRFTARTLRALTRVVPRRKPYVNHCVHKSPLAYQAEHYRDRMYED